GRLQLPVQGVLPAALPPPAGPAARPRRLRLRLRRGAHPAGAGEAVRARLPGRAVRPQGRPGPAGALRAVPALPAGPDPAAEVTAPGRRPATPPAVAPAPRRR